MRFFTCRYKEEIRALKQILCDWMLLNELFNEAQSILNSIQDNQQKPMASFIDSSYKVINFY